MLRAATACICADAVVLEGGPGRCGPVFGGPWPARAATQRLPWRVRRRSVGHPSVGVHAAFHTLGLRRRPLPGSGSFVVAAIPLAAPRHPRPAWGPGRGTAPPDATTCVGATRIGPSSGPATSAISLHALLRRARPRRRGPLLAALGGYRSRHTSHAAATILARRRVLTQRGGSVDGSTSS